DLGTGLLDEAAHRGRQLRALRFPVLDAIEREAEAFLAFTCRRTVEADALDEAPIATIARIGDDDVVVRAVPCPAPGESNDDHADDFPDPDAAKPGRSPGRPQKRRRL